MVLFTPVGVAKSNLSFSVLVSKLPLQLCEEPTQFHRAHKVLLVSAIQDGVRGFRPDVQLFSHDQQSLNSSGMVQRLGPCQHTFDSVVA